MPSGRREKVAILGGGTGALTAAYELSDPSLDGKYDITLFQLGWRLGGKGASGRNMDPAYSYRIEEHGVHVWAGLYENSFRIMRECYAELGRPPDAPLATWQDAFQPLDMLVVEEEYKGRWYPWSFPCPTNDQIPGDPDGTILPPLRTYLVEVLRLLHKHHQESKGGSSRLVERLEDAMISVLFYTGILLAVFVETIAKVINFLNRPLSRLVARLVHRVVLGLFGFGTRKLWARAKPRLDDANVRRMWIFANFTYGHIRGLIKDDILHRGVDVVDDQDYRTWLKKYLIDDGGLTVDSPLAFFLYDGAFAYRNGDQKYPDFSAAVALYIMGRLAFTWKGALYYRMMAGMGDAVFAPLYEVLKKRGVKFEFFSRVKNLHVSDDGESISGLTVAQQVKLKKSTYEPLVDVNGLPCWPATPLWDQIIDGDDYRRDGVNFEAHCTKDYGDELRLSVGSELDSDFNHVVLGISIGAFPYICCELIEAKPEWKEMVDQVLTVRTQAFQLWLKPTTYQLGWKEMGRPIVGTYDVSPLDTWADMTGLVCRESWPGERGRYPNSIAYFCGPMKDDVMQDQGCGPRQDCEHLSQKTGDAHVRQNVVDLLSNHMQPIWPHALDDSGFNWDLLIDNRHGLHEGQARLDAQYIRSNVQPTERYVMSLAGSTKYRLDSERSGFKNLALAGDWTNNGFNAGGIEAAVMSGMLASNFISGFPKRDRIIGLKFAHADSSS